MTSGSDHECHDVWVWNYIVSFSPTYREPILHFDVFDEQGAPLASEKVLQWVLDCNAASAGRFLLEDGCVKNTDRLGSIHRYGLSHERSIPPMVSIEQHPLLFRPMFLLHPCQTRDVMTLLTDDALRDRHCGETKQHSVDLNCSCKTMHMTSSETLYSTEVENKYSDRDVTMEHSPKDSDSVLYLLSWLSYSCNFIGVRINPIIWQQTIDSISSL